MLIFEQVQESSQEFILRSGEKCNMHFSRKNILGLKGKQNCLLLPHSTCMDKDMLVVVSEGALEQEGINKLLSQVHRIEMDGAVGFTGEVNSPLPEPSINKVLRKIFALKPKKVFVCLLNAVFNPKHERELRNVIRAAGYKAYISTDL